MIYAVIQWLGSISRSPSSPYLWDQSTSQVCTDRLKWSDPPPFNPDSNREWEVPRRHTPLLPQSLCECVCVCELIYEFNEKINLQYFLSAKNCILHSSDDCICSGNWIPAFGYCIINSSSHVFLRSIRHHRDFCCYLRWILIS